MPVWSVQAWTAQQHQKERPTYFLDRQRQRWGIKAVVPSRFYTLKDSDLCQWQFKPRPAYRSSFLLFLYRVWLSPWPFRRARMWCNKRPIRCPQRSTWAVWRQAEVLSSASTSEPGRRWRWAFPWRWEGWAPCGSAPAAGPGAPGPPAWPWSPEAGTGPRRCRPSSSTWWCGAGSFPWTWCWAPPARWWSSGPFWC